MADTRKQCRLSAVITGFLLLFGLGCTAPPNAPEDLESLLGYLFTHMDDEDPAELTDGLEKLHSYLQDDDKLQDAREGFVIKNLDDAAVNQLDDVERKASGLKGITVVTKSPNCVKDIAALLTWPDFKKVLDNFDLYEREFDRDPACFASRECLKIRADSRTRSKWANVVEMEARYAIQFRWVDTKYGRMLVHRFWLKEKVDGDLFDVKLYDNYYIGVAMADGARVAQAVAPAFRQAADGVIGRSGTDVEAIQELLGSAGTLRIHANWFRVSPGDIPLTEEQILEILTQNQVTDATRHDTWLADHPEQVSCTSADDDAGETPSGGTSGGESSSQMPSGGMSMGGQTSGGIQSGGVPSAGMPSAGIQSGGVPSTGTPSAGIPSGGAQSGWNAQSAGAQSGGVPSTGTPSAGIPSGGAQSGGVPSAGTPSAGIPSGGVQSGGVPSAGTPSAGIPSAGFQSGGVPSAGIPSAGTPSAGTPSAGVPSGGAQPGGLPAAGMPAGGRSGVIMNGGAPIAGMGAQ